MKKLIIILIILTGLSCSKDDACNCEKVNYETKVTVNFNSNGMPYTTVRNEIVSTEVVPCQDEKQVNEGNGYYVIRCE